MLTRPLIVFAIVCGVACGSAPSPAAPSGGSPSSSGRIVVLGDSLAVSPSLADSFPAVLQERLNARGGGWSVVNAGIIGDTSSGGVIRFDHSVPSGTHIVVLALGANDGLVFLCGMEAPPSHGWEYTVEFHQMFRRVAAAAGVPLVPFLLAGVALNPAMNGPDGIHPNAAGARRMAETVWPFLEALVAQEVPVAVAAGRVP
jgi:acyl-CoA thioesterase I